MPRTHAFTDDALGDHDAVGLAELVRRRVTTADELRAAALARAGQVAQLGAVVTTGPTATGAPDGPLAGVPTYAKDNIEVAGMPCGHGTAAFVPRPVAAHGPVTAQLLATGLDVLGTSRMPEFGFNASTEFDGAAPARNPWDPAYSPGASSGGAGVLVAAGVVPLAHANDGGGSIRIPAACCGLVGLKPGRGRLVPNPQGARLPIDLIADGVVSRTVRDSAAFLAAAERYRRNPALPPIGLVEGPAARRLRIGLVLDSPTGAATCTQTRAAVLDTARTLEKLGHTVEPAAIPIGGSFVEDFVDYWGMLAFLAASTGRWLLGRDFDPARMDGLSQGLRERYRRALPRTPVIVRRLRRVQAGYARVFAAHDLVLSPVVAHTTPPLGHLSPTVPYDELLRRLLAYVAFTPLNNVAGAPGLALPAGLSADGLPIGVHLSAAVGDERSLLEVAYAVEAERPFPRIQGP
ncbi:amidase [Pseudonocardia hydrocarbonoxydans]|uniref:Putative amidase AmiC n=1 Tax=Pseudonocardia hydrocarbonoxydans TaxID=76726 RepID=A0A4Y3WSY7_9PSEU|nr:amidase [Pseudonocardia hydrocarbonoxydans]GEC20466.1 putative amidase AmiC [Pseudonocardia hydrocarbonoxydans]